MTVTFLFFLHDFSFLRRLVRPLTFLNFFLETSEVPSSFFYNRRDKNYVIWRSRDLTESSDRSRLRKSDETSTYVFSSKRDVMDCVTFYNLYHSSSTKNLRFLHLWSGNPSILHIVLNSYENLENH